MYIKLNGPILTIIILLQNFLKGWYIGTLKETKFLFFFLNLKHTWITQRTVNEHCPQEFPKFHLVGSVYCCKGKTKTKKNTQFGKHNFNRSQNNMVYQEKSGV